MDAFTLPMEARSLAPEAVPKILMLDKGELAALIAGVVGSVLLALICLIVLLMWCLSRHKGSYVTNEMDDDDDMDCSDIMLQTNEPLTVDEDEESRIET